MVEELFNAFVFVGDSGDVTPVSGGSEVEFNTNDATAGSIAECDVTVTEDIDSCFIDEFPEITSSSAVTHLPPFITTSVTENNLLWQGNITPKAISPMTSNINVYTNVLHSSTSDNLKHLENFDRTQPSSPRIYNDFDRDRKEFKNFTKKSNIYDKDISSSSKNISAMGADKWCTSKEKFLDNTLSLTNECKIPEESSTVNPGTVLVKEHFIEPPRMNRISRSFHGKSSTSTSFLDISVTPRRASEGVPLCSRHLSSQPEPMQATSENRRKSNALKSGRPQLLTQLSSPNTSTTVKNPGLNFRKTSLTDPGMGRMRFTTTLVNEAEHAASVGASVKPVDTEKEKENKTQL